MALLFTIFFNIGTGLLTSKSCCLFPIRAGIIHLFEAGVGGSPAGKVIGLEGIKADGIVEILYRCFVVLKFETA